MDPNSQNAGTESPAGETTETSNGTNPDTSAQATPPEPDLGELLGSLSADELRQMPQVKKLLDDQAAGIKAKYKPRSTKPTTKQESNPASPGTASNDPPEWLSDLVGPLVEEIGGLKQIVQTLQSAREADTFDAQYASAGMPEHLKQDIKDLATLRKPKDMSKFLGDMRKKFGVTDTPPAADQQTKASAPQQPKGSPSPGAPPNGGERDLTGTVNPFTMTAEEIARARQDGRLVSILDRWRNRDLPKRQPVQGTK